MKNMTMSGVNNPLYARRPGSQPANKSRLGSMEMNDIRSPLPQQKKKLPEGLQIKPRMNFPLQTVKKFDFDSSLPLVFMEIGHWFHGTTTDNRDLASPFSLSSSQLENQISRTAPIESGNDMDNLSIQFMPQILSRQFSSNRTILKIL